MTQNWGALGGSIVLASGAGFGAFAQTLFLLLLRLGTVFVQKLEQLGG